MRLLVRLFVLSEVKRSRTHVAVCKHDEIVSFNVHEG